MSPKNKNNLNLLRSEIENKYTSFKEAYKSDKSTKAMLHDIWNLSKEIFKRKWAMEKFYKKYKGLIFTVGFSFEPIVLNIVANEPEAVFFIYTKESEEVLNRIIEETGLKPNQYKREIMKKSSFKTSIDLIGFGILYLNKEKEIDISQIGLDITGGTKIMSMACGIAAFLLGPDGPDIFYVDHEVYDQELRRPVPGTEFLIVINNPLRPVKKSFEEKGLDFHHTVI